MLSTPEEDELVQATLQHVVVTFDSINGRRIWVNGEDSGSIEETKASLSDWDSSFALVLGNEAGTSNGQIKWQGAIRLLAIHNRVLTSDQIKQNQEVGVGQKFALLFSVAEQVGLEETYVMFEVSQFDDYSYLFSDLSIINLNGATLDKDLAIKGIRISINGKEANTGQAFNNLDLSLPANTDLTQPVSLSSIGTIIAVEKGVGSDQFFLTFEQLSDQQYSRTPEQLPPRSASPDLAEHSKIGLRNFAEINASMSVLTEVSRQQPQVAELFARVQQQLPPTDNINTFVSSHQMAITQLAIAYCSALVDDATLSASFFPGFDFNAAPNVAFTSQNRDLIIKPLISRLSGINLATQADDSEISTELNDLIDKLSSCGQNCAADRTKTVVKASCAALLGSATLLLQ